MLTGTTRYKPTNAGANSEVILNHGLANEKLKISVLMPAFNASKTLDRALRSVAAQSKMPDEIIVVDDASTDDTAAICRRWQTQLPLKLARNTENQGVARSLARGAGMASGDWLLRLDSDDEWDAQHVELLTRKIGGRVALIAAPARCFNGVGREIGRSRYVSGKNVRAVLMKDNPFVHSATGFRLSTYREIGGYDIHKKWEDYDLWIRLLMRGDLGFCDEPTVRYYVSAASVSRGPRAKALDARWMCQKMAIRLFWREAPLHAVIQGAVGSVRRAGRKLCGHKA